MAVKAFVFNLNDCDSPIIVIIINKNWKIEDLKPNNLLTSNFIDILKNSSLYLKYELFENGSNMFLSFKRGIYTP